MPELSTLFRLDGRVALVTGAGRGIGAAVARYLGAAGAEVVLVARTESELRSVAAQIESAGGRARVHPCDVTDTGAVRALVDSLPRLDVVVNHAGHGFPEPMLEVSDEHLDAAIELNTRAVFIVAQSAARKMLQDPARRERGGAVINMSSQMGHVGSPNQTVYCMTEHAVEGLTKAMAVELAPEGIRVNSIGPTLVNTPLIRRVIDKPEQSERVLSKIPLGRLASVSDIAAAAVYLASPAAAMVTGTCLRVDGGWTAQ